MKAKTSVNVRVGTAADRARSWGVLSAVVLCLGHGPAIRAEAASPRHAAKRVPSWPAEVDETVGPGAGLPRPLAGACQVDADCNDGVGCTNDVCNPITGVCEHATGIRETICRPGYLETEPGFQCDSTCSGDGTEPCVPGVDENLLGRLGFNCPKRYTFHNVLPVSHDVELTTWALGSFSSLDQYYNIHLVGTTFTEANIYKVGQDDCTSTAPHVFFTISAADFNAAIADPGSGVGDIIFEITASPAVSCSDCTFAGGVHLEFALQACDDGVGCTEDVCDEILDCVSTPNDTLCNNGLFCDGVEHCDAALDCVTDPTSIPNCDDGIGCTNDICNEVTDACEHAVLVRETVCRPGYQETEPGFACVSPCSGNGTEPCIMNGDPTILGRLGFNCPKRYTFFDALEVNRDVHLTTWAKGNYSGSDQYYNIHLVGTDFTKPGIYKLTGLDDCSDAPTPVPFTISADVWNAAVNDPISGVGDVVFEITAPPSVACSDCGFNGGVHLEFELQPCDDGLFCNGVETCDPLADCQTGSAPCTDPLLPVCDEANAICVQCLTDADCDDGLFCTGTEVCTANVCQPGTPPVADDGIDCTADFCDEVNDTVVHAPDDAACDDGLFCNGVETCDLLADCQTGSAPCTDPLLPVCDAANAICVQCLTDADCDDGLFCTGTEVCTASVCQPGTPPLADDGIDCTADFCDEVNDTVVHAPDNTGCDDGLFCNGVETCGAAGCQPGSEPCIDPLLPFCDEVGATCVACLASGDVNGDQVIDLTDFGDIETCATGPVGPTDPPAYAPSCQCLDTEQDGDIDLSDFQWFQQEFGSTQP